MTRSTVGLTVLAVVFIAGCDVVFGIEVLPDARGADGPDAPDAPLPAERWSVIDGGTSHTCGIRVDHTLWCWGRNDYGQLGLGAMPSIPEVDEPRQVGTKTQWATVSTSGQTTCAVELDGALWCWGRNERGQVGDGLIGDDKARLEPFQITGVWTAVASGPRHTCAIDSSKALWCWGHGLDGQRGDQTNTDNVALPTAVVGGSRWTAVEVGGRSTCAIQEDRSLWCWGDNLEGQLGIGKPPDRVNLPTRVDDEAWVELALGESFACGVLDGGALRCWGENNHGQVGDGTTTNKLRPTVVDNDQIVDWRHLEAGSDHICGVHGSGESGGSGEVACWGANTYGQLAFDAATPFRSVPTPVAGGSEAPWTSIGIGAQHSCAIDDAGELWCAGYAATGALGVGEGSHTSPTLIAGNWAFARTGDDATCAVSPTTSTVSCWGYDGEGLVGDGDELRDRAVPVATPSGLPSNLGAVIALDLGDHALAIDGNAQLWPWGANDAGQIGDNTVIRKTVPTHQAGFTWRRVSASRAHSCGVTQALALFCWGRNAELQTGYLSPPPYAPVLVPRQVSGVWSDVSAGIDHTCGIKSDAKVYCWGHNGFGQLGVTSPTTNVPQAVVITGAVALDAVDVGGRYSCARGGGQVWCWGANTYGQLGDGTTSTRMTPTSVPGDWRDIALGEFHMCGIRNDGTLWCWGQNAFGQLGIDNLFDRSIPTQVGVATDWDTVDAGRQHTCATKLGGTLHCWGTNHHGALGWDPLESTCRHASLSIL